MRRILAKGINEELLINGNFKSNVNSWTRKYVSAGETSIIWNNGDAIMNYNPENPGFAQGFGQAVFLKAGGYRVEFQVGANTQSTAQVSLWVSDGIDYASGFKSPKVDVNGSVYKYDITISSDKEVTYQVICYGASIEVNYCSLKRK